MSERKWTDPADDRTWWIRLTSGGRSDRVHNPLGEPVLHFRSGTEEHAIPCPDAKPIQRFDDEELRRWLERAAEADREA